MDQLIVLKPDSLDYVIFNLHAMFALKMLGYIRDVVNPKDYKNLYYLIQRCNEDWEC
jgi:hypothetical protein